MENNDLNQKENDLNFNIDMSTPQPSAKPEADTKLKIESISQKNMDKKQKSSQKISSSQKIDFTNFLSYAKNPFIVFFTIFFKGLGIAIFLILGIFGVSESFIFILVVILNSLDFWFVKNISGRILVGLRWWNEVKEDGSEVWRYESSNEKKEQSIDTFIFWASLYISTGFWGIFLILEIIGLKIMWCLLCLIGLILSSSNLLGYLKCSSEQKSKIAGFINDKTKEGFSKIMQLGVKALGSQQLNQ